MLDSGSIEIFIIQVTMLLVITEDVIIFTLIMQIWSIPKKCWFVLRDVLKNEHVADL